MPRNADGIRFQLLRSQRFRIFDVRRRQSQAGRQQRSILRARRQCGATPTLRRPSKMLKSANPQRFQPRKWARVIRMASLDKASAGVSNDQKLKPASRLASWDNRGLGHSQLNHAGAQLNQAATRI
jgi:hypothetical protein